MGFYPGFFSVSLCWKRVVRILGSGVLVTRRPSEQGYNINFALPVRYCTLRPLLVWFVDRFPDFQECSDGWQMCFGTTFWILRRSTSRPGLAHRHTCKVGVGATTNTATGMPASVEIARSMPWLPFLGIRGPGFAWCGDEVRDDDGQREGRGGSCTEFWYPLERLETRTKFLEWESTAPLGEI